MLQQFGLIIFTYNPNHVVNTITLKSFYFRKKKLMGQRYSSEVECLSSIHKVSCSMTSTTNKQQMKLLVQGRTIISLFKSALSLSNSRQWWVTIFGTVLCVYDPILSWTVCQVSCAASVCLAACRIRAPPPLRGCAKCLTGTETEPAEAELPYVDRSQH